MDKCVKEKELLARWANNHKQKYDFAKIEEDEETYYIKREKKEYIREYNLQSLPDIQKELERMWQDAYMREMIKIVGVSAMKNKPEYHLVNEGGDTRLAGNTEEQLMPYIYNF